MFWVTTKRIFRSGFISFWRNGSVSLSAVFVMVVALFMIASTLLLTAFLSTGLSELEDKIDINIYLTPGARETAIFDFKEKLERLPEVREVVYISADEAIAAFRARHANDHRIIEALDEIGDNPLTAVLNVKAREPSQYEGIARALEGNNSALASDTLSIVSKVNYNDNKIVIDRLNSLIAGVKKLGAVVTALMIGISVLITFNTIRLAIFIARDEIAVMRLVGGNNGYIRGPFLVEGIMYGFVSGVLTIIIFYPLTYWLKATTANFYGGIDLLHYFVANFIQIFFIIILSGIILGAASSYLAVRKYLSV